VGRGIFSGVIWGTLVAFIALWLLSQMGGIMAALSGPPKNVVVQAPAASQIETTSIETAPEAPAIQTAPATDPSRQNAELQTAPADETPGTDTDIAVAPVTGNVAQAMAEPESGNAPDVIVATAQVPTSLQGTAIPQAPSEDAKPIVNLLAPQPDVSQPEPRLAQAPPAPDSASPERPVSGERAPLVAEPALPAAPHTEATPLVDFSQPQVVVLPEPTDTAEAPEPGPEPAPQPQPTPVVVMAEPEPVPVPDREPTVLAPVAETAPEPVASEIASNETAEVGSIMQPVTGIGDRATNVKINRLPTIGGASDATAPEPDPTVEPAPTGGRAIEQFAVAFENPDNRPLMAILLLVDNEAALTTRIEKLPFQVSYVVDASKPNASLIAQAYRNGGNEVVALAPLPPGAKPKDVEVAFLTYVSAMPEAVAFMDTPIAAFQSGRSVSAQVVEALAASGHGMITYSRGLNSGTQVAESEGVPAALVFREFDKAGEDNATIQRFLDQAAFRAGQQNGVILVGSNRPETVQALLEWSLGNRAETVALAPVSAALQNQ